MSFLLLRMHLSHHDNVIIVQNLCATIMHHFGEAHLQHEYYV